MINELLGFHACVYDGLARKSAETHEARNDYFKQAGIPSENYGSANARTGRPSAELEAD